ncbi:MAG: hypothetical protein K8F91_22785 [Candidatus Obscuribacterales bacterium]|nr:hypothetical protein [Candidatus Obscuribacterales bacterium]
MTENKQASQQTTTSSYLGWILSAIAGFVIGGLVTLLPFYLHALNDWDLSDKSTLFPAEAIQIVQFYSSTWMIGAVIGALLFIAIFAGIKAIRKKKL